MKLPSGLLQAGLLLSPGGGSALGEAQNGTGSGLISGLEGGHGPVVHGGFGGLGEGGHGPVVHEGGGLGGAALGGGGAMALGGAQGGDASLQSAIAQVLQILQKQGGNKLDLSGGEGGNDDAGMQAPQLQAPQVSQPQPGQAPQGAQNTQGAQGAQNAPAAKSDDSAKPSADDKRPPGDNRSAQDIIDGDPNLKNLGNQGDTKGPANPDGGGLRDGLKKQCGDFEHDPDAAYRASKVLGYIKSCKNREGGDRSDEQIHNGKLDGITKSGDARHGTEAGMLQDFGKNGYGALPDNHQLDKTKDTHVKLDGTNKDNFQWAVGEVGKKLWFIPGLSNVLTGVGNSSGGLGGMIKGGLGGVVKTWKGVAEGIVDGLKHGRIRNPLSLLTSAYKGALKDGENTPKGVSSVMDKLPI